MDRLLSRPSCIPKLDIDPEVLALLLSLGDFQDDFSRGTERNGGQGDGSSAHAGFAGLIQLLYSG